MPVLDGDADLGDVQAFLRREPALNSVPLGLLIRALTTAAERTKLFVATVEFDRQVVAVALRVDYPKMILAAAGDDAQLAELARLVYARMPDLPCVLGQDRQVAAFVTEWERLAGTAGRAGTPQRLHSLDRVRAQPNVPGALRVARADDFHMVHDWFGAFEAEALPAEARLERTLRDGVARNIEAESIFLWTNPDPVSMAGAREFGEGIARIGPVFTPPGLRRQGYGGALTAAVSQQMLDQGCTACCLFTDLRNPTSNHIYREVGYQPLADFNEFWFDSG
jgi:predicted GNAT family acetyltransferase